MYNSYLAIYISFLSGRSLPSHVPTRKGRKWKKDYLEMRYKKMCSWVECWRTERWRTSCSACPLMHRLSTRPLDSQLIFFCFSLLTRKQEDKNTVNRDGCLSKLLMLKSSIDKANCCISKRHQKIAIYVQSALSLKRIDSAILNHNKNTQ